MFNLSSRVRVFQVQKDSDWCKDCDLRIFLRGRYTKAVYVFGILFQKRELMDADLFELYVADSEDIWQILTPRVQPLKTDFYAMGQTWLRTFKPEVRGECGYFSVGSDVELLELQRKQIGFGDNFELLEASGIDAYVHAVASV